MLPSTLPFTTALLLSGWSSSSSSWATGASTPPYPNATDPPIRLLYEYPPGSWIENLAVRPSGELLLTILTQPHLDQLDPFQIFTNGTTTPAPELEPETLVVFPNATSVAGIAQVEGGGEGDGGEEEEEYVMNVGTFDFGDFSAVNGTFGFWSVGFKGDGGGGVADVREVARTPEIVFRDGVCELRLPGAYDEYPEGDAGGVFVLTADIKGGNIWRVDVTTGEYVVVIENEYTEAVADPVFGTAGVNGVHVVDGDGRGGGWLYFTNTGLGIFGRMGINSNGTVVGSDAVEIISRTGTDSTVEYYDDFAILGEDAYLVTGSGNSIEKVGLVDGEWRSMGRIVAGGKNSTAVAEPTSCAFGRTERDWWVLYVVTAGGLATPVNGDEKVGAQVLAVDTRAWEGLVKQGLGEGMGWKGEWE